MPVAHGNLHHVAPIKRLGPDEVDARFVCKLKASEPLRQNSDCSKEAEENSGRALIEIKTRCKLTDGRRLLVERHEHTRLIRGDNGRLIVSGQPQIPHPSVVCTWRFIFRMFHIRCAHSPTLNIMPQRESRRSVMPATKVQYMNPPTLSTPTGYTHVVQVQGGRTVYIAGQV